MGVGSSGWRCAVACLLWLVVPAHAAPLPVASVQGQMAPMAGSQSSQSMSGKMGMNMAMDAAPDSFVAAIEHHASSGTTAEPNSTPAPMWMSMHGGWMLMFHGNAFVADTQQTGPRGADKFFSTNWFMPMAQRKLGPGELTLRTMLSLEPATVTGERYPLLFQQGETAYGKPIADGQHPHNFFMELAALYDWELGERTLLSFYGGPVGDPAIGPTAYPHRASALEDPVGALGHHQEDSTHISFDVVTVGLAHEMGRVGLRIEGSGFHGREPNEHRWEMQQGALDSWSTRLTVQPGQNWSGQYSYARITSPEQLDPSENQERMTASVMYNRPIGDGRGNWANSVVWGRTRSLPGNAIENSYLLESTLRFARSNYLYTRLENVDRTTELVNGENPLPAGFVEEPAGKVQAYTGGYDRDVKVVPHMETAIGAQATLYGVPAALKPVYEPGGGAAPVGFVVFLRIRPAAADSR